MINAPQAVIDALGSGNFSYANLVTVNLGDAYNLGSDVILYLTDYGHSISFGGNTYTPDNNLIELEGISRKASTGSDAVDIVFSVTDENLIAVIRSERYVNKPTSIDRVIMQDGNIIADFTIPVRTAWAISYSIDGDLDDRTITLTIDSSLGDLMGDNGWYTINASHEQRYAGDLIMRHSSTVMTEEQQKKYTTNFKGVISQEVKPPALSKIYGYKNVELIPICLLKHRKTHTSYRHYFTTMIYAINIGECDHVDINNLMKDGEQFDGKVVSNTKTDVGGWSVRIRTPSDAQAGDVWSEKNGDLSFWFEGMDYHEEIRMYNMYGKGLTLLFVKNRNRDDWLQSPPKFTVPVRGAKCYDDRSGLTVFTRNPALQYADYLQSTEYGAGKRGIPVIDANIISLADHFDQIPDSIGNAGINSILIDVQVDTGEPIVDNMNIWMEGVRLYTSDYYGKFNIRVETKGAVDWVLNEEDLIDYPEYESGEFTDRINQLTYTIKQLVADTSEDAEAGDLVEVDVEATFPADGSQTHLDWLAEDGGIQNFESEQLSYVTELEQAFYWAMVDARISRRPQELEIKVGAKGWLSEVGDILDFSSTIMDMTNELWRVDEVAEDEGDVELKLVAYDDTFYTPDPLAIPDPVGVAQPPTGVILSPVSGLAIIEKSGFYYLDWTAPSSSNVSWYAVEIDKDDVLIVDEPRIAQPPLLLESLTVGDYKARVTTIGINNESDTALLSFSIAEPEKPTINFTPDNFSVEIRPTITLITLGSIFELKFNTVDNINSATNKGKAGVFTLIGLLVDTEYYVWVRTVNIIGVSEWVSASFTTLDGTSFFDSVREVSDLNQSNLNQATSDLIDQLNRTLPNNIPDKLDHVAFSLKSETAGRQDLSKAVFDNLAAYANFRDTYERRTISGENLIDAAVYVDPATGLIINRAFAYTDTSFSQVQTIIDGVNAKITLNAQKIAVDDQRITDAESTLTVQAGQINLRATYTEVTSEISRSMDAITPAVSWQFNTGKDGWTGGTWNEEGFLKVTATTPVSITGLNIDADANPTISARIRNTTPTTGVFSWNGLNQKYAIAATTGNPNAWESRVRTLTASDGWTGIITSIEIETDGIKDLDFDHLTIGKPSASQSQLEDITARTTTIESDMDAGTGRMATYATTSWVNNLGYQTQAKVQTEIDSFNTTYNISATLEAFDDNDTLTKANSAQSWVDGANSNITDIVVAWADKADGINEQITTAQTDIDAVKGEISNTIVSLNGLELEGITTVDDVFAAYNDFMQKGDIERSKVNFAYANTKLSAVATEQESQASELTLLITATEQAQASASAAINAISNDRQATVVRTANLRAEMGEGDTKAVAEANEYTRASVGYCVDGDGNITSENNAVQCVTDGGSWIEGALAEFIRNLQIDKGGKKASINDIRQVFEDEGGKLIARGGAVSDVNGRISGYVNTNDGSLSNFDIIADYHRVGVMVDDVFVPLFSLDLSDPLNPRMSLKGSGEFSGTLKIGGNTLTENNTLNQNITKDNVTETGLNAGDVGADASGSANTAEQAAKDYADGKFVDSTTYGNDLATIQAQVDKNITTWFYTGVPTLANAPANTWADNTERNVHLGDIYFDNDTEFSYRFKLLTGVYSWKIIKDSDITTAIANAANAQDTADSKRRVFVAQPVTPYDVGDLWDTGSGVKRCQTAKLESGAYAAGDWIEVADVTDYTTISDDAASKADTAKDEAISQAATDANSADKTDGLVGGWTIDSTDIYSGADKTIGSDGYKVTAGIVLKSDGSLASPELQLNSDGSAKFKGKVFLKHLEGDVTETKPYMFEAKNLSLNNAITVFTGKIAPIPTGFDFPRVFRVEEWKMNYAMDGTMFVVGLVFFTTKYILDGVVVRTISSKLQSSFGTPPTYFEEQTYDPFFYDVPNSPNDIEFKITVEITSILDATNIKVAGGSQIVSVFKEGDTLS